MIVLVDNYDSFSYNLYQMLGEMDRHIAVVRNDEKTVSEIEAMHPEFPRDRADRQTRESAKRLFCILQGKSPSSGYAWGIRPYVKCLAGKLPMRIT